MLKSFTQVHTMCCFVFAFILSISLSYSIKMFAFTYCLPYFVEKNDFQTVKIPNDYAQNYFNLQLMPLVLLDLT